MDIKISQLPDGTTLDGSEELPVVQGGETVKVTVKDVANFAGGGQDLDATLANGNISTRNIKLTSGAFIEADGYIKTRRSRVTDGTLLGEIKAPVANFTADRFYRLPDASGTFVITVNSIAPDANGNLVITSIAPTSHTHPISDIINLQTELDLRITTTDADARYYPLSSNPAGYLTTTTLPVYGLSDALANDNTTGAYDIIIDSSSDLVLMLDSKVTYQVGSYVQTLYPGDITLNRDIALPNASGIIAMSVNGHLADAQGNITLAITETQNLQNVTDLGSTTTNDIVLSDGASLEADGNVTARALYIQNGTGAFYGSLQYPSGGFTANRNYTLPEGSGVLPLTVNSTVADDAGDIQVGLQSVTDVSFSTTNPINAGGFATAGNSYAGDLAVYAGGRLRLIDITGTYSFQFDLGGLTQDYIVSLPTPSVTTSYLPLSVNGVYADSTGDITISSGGVSSITGTTNRISVTGTTTPVIDISSSYVGQSSITTLGTITTGTWHGTAIADTYISSATTWNGKQNALSGTGFVKISGTTISYDTSTYITASSTNTLTNKSGNNSMWTNDSGFITASSSSALTNKTGNISQWTNDSGYLTSNQTITLTGEATGTGTGSFGVTLANSAVIGKVLTGYTSGAGTVAASDTILQAIQKLNGNIAAGGGGGTLTFTGDVTGTGTSSIALTIGANKVTNSMLAGSIAYSKLSLTGAILNADLAGSISLSKLSALTASRGLVTDGSGVIVSSSVTATEHGYLSGVTSSIQTQVDSKLDKSLASYKMYVNNTGSTANATTTTFKQVAEQTYSGTITWTGTTAPSGTTNHVYRWQQIGNRVSYQIILNYATPSSATSIVVFDLPSDMPNPIQPTGLIGASMYLANASGGIYTGSTSTPTTQSCGIRLNAASTGYELSVATSSGTHRMVMVRGEYFTS